MIILTSAPRRSHMTKTKDQPEPVMQPVATELQGKSNTKDTVFRFLYKDKKKLLSLYNSINHTTYTNEADLTIVTLENAVYMNYKNDIAFLLADFLNLYEQQSTYNPNMPMRLLIYVAHEYQKLTQHLFLYSSTIQKIPAPRFFVFYNGTAARSDKEILLLSDAYSQPQDDPELELKVTMLNINYGHNKELLEQCQSLKEYSVYVARVRENMKTMNISEAVVKAVDECIKENILAEFLTENKVEVIGLSIFEYDKEREEALLRKEERENGIAIGEKKGIAIGEKKGIVIGEERILLLMEALLKQNRTEDIARIKNDIEFRKQLLQEFHIN